MNSYLNIECYRNKINILGKNGVKQLFKIYFCCIFIKIFEIFSETKINILGNGVKHLLKNKLY